MIEKHLRGGDRGWRADADSVAGVYGGRNHNGTLAVQVSVRHRAQFELCLQGKSRRH
jgi:hypothetical protein